MSSTKIFFNLAQFHRKPTYITNQFSLKIKIWSIFTFKSLKRWGFGNINSSHIGWEKETRSILALTRSSCPNVLFVIKNPNRGQTFMSFCYVANSLRQWLWWPSCYGSTSSWVNKKLTFMRILFLTSTEDIQNSS